MVLTICCVTFLELSSTTLQYTYPFFVAVYLSIPQCKSPGNANGWTEWYFKVQIGVHL
uniref:Uncharacterized protein n=1 Tax=Arundo donax TaxID=35708 RepID=A0A0A9SGS2_ARUDO